MRRFDEGFVEGIFAGARWGIPVVVALLADDVRVSGLLALWLVLALVEAEA